MPPISLVCALSSFAFIVEPMCCEQQRERAAQPSKEPQRGVNSVNGKVKRNHLNTPRYEYSDVYTHAGELVTKPGQLRWTHLSGDVRV